MVSPGVVAVVSGFDLLDSTTGFGFPELGMEAIYEFDVKDMPVTVAVDSRGESVHITGPKIWKAKIEEQALEIK